MRWTILSIVSAIILICLGFWVTATFDLNVAPKALYWFTVVGFLSAQAIHFAVWVRKHDL